MQSNSKNIASLRVSCNPFSRSKMNHRRSTSRTKQLNHRVPQSKNATSPLPRVNPSQVSTCSNPEPCEVITSTDNGHLCVQDEFTVQFCSQVGCNKGKPKKHNQDSFVVCPKISPSLHFFAVFDGHGKNGHVVSNMLKEQLPQNLIEGTKILSESGSNLLKLSIAKTVKAIESSPVNTDLSGSTLVAVLMKANRLICANVGDSRAVLGRLCNSWEAINLTNDHKPDVLEERIRIQRANGLIRPYINSSSQPVGPERVWLENDIVPGLAMTRSIGDKVAHTVGVLSVPEITSCQIFPNDHFVILATDGLWEFVNSQEAVDIVGKCIDAGCSENACTALAKKAVKRWKQFDVNIDDITIILILLK